MDAYEATKIVFQRIQNLDPQNASKIMGFLLIQDHGEKEMIRLAFGSESLLQSVILQAKKELNLASSPPTPSSPLPFSNPLSLSRQNSAPSRTVNGVNLPSPLSVANHSSTVASSWTNSSGFSDDLISSPSTMNSAAAPFYGGAEVDLIDELHLQEQLSFLNDGSPPLGPRSSDLYYQDLSSSPTGTDPSFFPSYPWGGAAAAHRRSCSVSDICLGSDDLSGGFGWKPCLFYARGFCKNGTSCRFLHGEGDCGAPAVGSPNKYEVMEQCQELIRSKLTQQQQQQLMASSNFPYSQLPASKCLNFLQLPPDSPRALMMGRGRLERGEFAMNGVNPGSRQIYLTFPADSTFKEEDVSSYFSKFGPVQDVRIPYQQKRMFGFVTFDYPETVKLILAKGNPHFVCDARVLVKPYKEKGKIPDKHRKQQHMERGEFAGCGSPTGLDSRDPYDLGARMFYNSQDMLWGRKLEAQADLQQAIEIQNRRLMGLQLLDIKRNSHHRTLSGGAVISSPTTFSPTFFNQNPPSNLSSPEAKEDHAADAKDKDERSDGNDTPHKESYFQESSLEHNLPDSPFASPKATAFSTDTQEVEKGSASLVSAPTTNNNLITGPSMAPFKSCYFQVPRFASGHETVGM